LKDSEVPKAARDSVAGMADDIVNAVVDDFIKELNAKGKTISPDGIDTLKSVVMNRVVISLKIKAAVTLELVEDMKISIRDMDQAGLQEFEA